MSNAYRKYRISLLLAVCMMVLNYLHAQDSTFTEKHIYDSSENFFNWREDLDESYYINLSSGNPKALAKIQAYKKDKNFWYVDAIEELENKFIVYEQMRDSLAKTGSIIDDQQQAQAPSKKRGKGKVDEDVSVLMDSQSYFTPAVWVALLLLLLILLGGFIFFNKDNVLLRKNSRVKHMNEEEANENIFSIAYASAIAMAEQDGKYPRAIRLMYLEMIKLMSESAIITYQPDLTNMDYLAQLRKSRYFDPFITITRHYEFSWYGKREVTETTYKRIKEDFTAFKTILK